ncbi:metalloprotease [Haloarcula sp. S1CR25-12]|uniref:Metalloprotease n=1 Tax=Haloarcula saliterrae TaxID=2950534 RepID=A0ABU2F882_9EURY|nr:metalloprotease [Haloarcula sp. S1CR25-12]MDS0258454.1 metalloprotease [Haloarcula sp. S1CR25-12]
MGLQFSQREVRDLAVAWLALGIAFTLLLERQLVAALDMGGALTSLSPGTVLSTLVVSLLTVGVGFLLHEVAHKVVAVRFGQVAAFRADYRMLGFAIVGALVGFLFAAPGAVVHRGRITPKENGLIALAGPVTNILLAVVFLLPYLVVEAAGTTGFLADLATRGLQINLLLAGFNMLPFGPLDGRKIRAWSTLIWAAVAVPSILLAVGALFLL